MKSTPTQQLRDLHIQFMRLFSSILSYSKLSFGAYALLSQLLHEHKLSMTEMSKRLSISKPAVTHLVKRLEKKGFLSRTQTQKDQRCFTLKISEQGRQATLAVQNMMLSFVYQSIESLKATERKSVDKYFETLLGTMAKFFREKCCKTHAGCK